MPLTPTHLTTATHAPVHAERQERAGAVRLADKQIHDVEAGDWIVSDQMGRQVVWKDAQFATAFVAIGSATPIPPSDALEIVRAFVATERERQRSSAAILDALDKLVKEIIQLRAVEAVRAGNGR